MKPALKGMANLGNLPETDPRVQGFNQLFSAIHDVVSRPHASYDAFRTALKPLMDQARAATGPQQGGRPGENLFAPPHLYHVMAKGFGQGEGLLGLEYAGHNVHWSQVEQALNSDRSNAR